MPVLEDGAVKFDKASFTNQVGQLAVGHVLLVYFCWWRAILSIRKKDCQLLIKNNDKLPRKSFDNHLQQLYLLLLPGSGELQKQKFKSHLMRTQSLNVLP